MSLQQQQQIIDQALATYLDCLDRYSLLRQSLADLHGQTLSSIARANFTTDRGVRHGQEYYDARMRASRFLRICVPRGDGAPVYSVMYAGAGKGGDCFGEAVGESCGGGDGGDGNSEGRELVQEDGRLESETKEEVDETTVFEHKLDADGNFEGRELVQEDERLQSERKDEADETTVFEHKLDADGNSQRRELVQEDGRLQEEKKQDEADETTVFEHKLDADGNSQRRELVQEDGRLQEEKKQDEADETAAPQHNVDALRWFGILTPRALHQAQDTSIQVVERLLPQLASVVGEMGQLEIVVRRARKARAKIMKQMAHGHQVASAEETSRADTLAKDSGQPRGSDEAILAS
ncbi:hypothetical protein CDD81_6940 [Ophiocordyceps australis]|uniref:Vacuolar ATPase assembly protein VMA22 n=1 Tax=Ophiocordyceps australis TaxID=1399860 RepID=A0A2C5Y6F9_9HYPO|nr:hypothetical protein CDD81_6940 [Ophiocordyceps australis]